MTEAPTDQAGDPSGGSGLIVRAAGASACEFEVRVQPGASRAGVVGIKEGMLSVRLASPPVDGRANVELLALMGSALGVRPREIELVRGHTGRTKTVRVERESGVLRTLVTACIPPNRPVGR